jgi:hypothetical protein
MTSKGVIEGSQQLDPLLAQGRQVTADATEHHYPTFGTETAGDLLLHFDHPKISLRLVVVKRNRKIEQEAQRGPLPRRRVDPADCAQGFVWLAPVFAWTAQTSSVRQEGDWPGSLP